MIQLVFNCQLLNYPSLILSADKSSSHRTSHLVELEEDSIFNEDDLDSVNEVLSPSYMNNNMEVIDKSDLYHAYIDNDAEIETINNAKNHGANSTSGESLRTAISDLQNKIRISGLNVASNKPVVKRLKTADFNLASTKSLFRNSNYQIVNSKAIALNNFNGNGNGNTGDGSLFFSANDASHSNGLADSIGMINGQPVTTQTLLNNAPIISMPDSPALVASNPTRNNMMIREANPNR